MGADIMNKSELMQRIAQLKEMRDMHQSLMNEEIIRLEIQLNGQNYDNNTTIIAPEAPTPTIVNSEPVEKPVAEKSATPVEEVASVTPTTHKVITEEVMEDIVEPEVNVEEIIPEPNPRRTRYSLANVHSSIKVDDVPTPVSTVEESTPQKPTEPVLEAPSNGQIMDQVDLTDASVESIIASNENILAQRKVSNADASAIMALGQIDDD